MQLTFKSGAQVTVDVDKFTTARDAVTLEFNSLRWETPDEWTAKLHTANLAEVVAVVALREPEDAQ